MHNCPVFLFVNIYLFMYLKDYLPETLNTYYCQEFVSGKISGIHCRSEIPVYYVLFGFSLSGHI